MLSSIIICAYNHLYNLSIPCLAAVVQNTRTPYELILIDDGSSDGTYEYFKTLTPKAIRLYKNQGPGVARNQAFEIAQGDFLAFLDNDITVPLGWLSSLIDAAKMPGVGIVGGIPSNETSRLSLPRDAAGYIPVEHIGIGFSIVTRDCRDKLGFFDETLSYAASDTDYCFRATWAGFRVLSHPGVIGEHRSFGTRHQVSGKVQESLRRFYRKWYGKGSNK